MSKSTIKIVCTTDDGREMAADIATIELGTDGRRNLRTIEPAYKVAEVRALFLLADGRNSGIASTLDAVMMAAAMGRKVGQVAHQIGIELFKEIAAMPAGDDKEKAWRMLIRHHDCPILTAEDVMALDNEDRHFVIGEIFQAKRDG